MAYPVSTKVNNPTNDTPDCITPERRVVEEERTEVLEREVELGRRILVLTDRSRSRRTTRPLLWTLCGLGTLAGLALVVWLLILRGQPTPPPTATLPPSLPPLQYTWH